MLTVFGETTLAFVFGVVFAWFTRIGRTELVFTCNAVSAFVVPCLPGTCACATEEDWKRHFRP